MVDVSRVSEGVAAFFYSFREVLFVLYSCSTKETTPIPDEDVLHTCAKDSRVTYLLQYTSSVYDVRSFWFADFVGLVTESRDLFAEAM